MPITPLSIGEAVPSFQLIDQDGATFSLADYSGQKLILFFYPRDNTPTCTAEACNLRDNYSLLKEKGYEVIGISTDSARKHQNFIKKHSLPFRLVADTENQLTETFGVWGEKQMYGKKYMGLFRTTFIIDEEGKVAHVIEKVKAKEHTDQLMALIEPAAQPTA